LEQSTKLLIPKSELRTGGKKAPTEVAQKKREVKAEEKKE